MRKFILTVLVASAFALAACDGGTSTPTSASPSPSSSSISRSSPPAGAGATVALGQTTFAQNSVTLSAGQTLHIVDPADSGGTHNLCLGRNGQCDQAAQGPSELAAPGLMLTPGTSKDVAFPHAGTYQITCTIHPSMQLIINVLGTGS